MTDDLDRIRELGDDGPGPSAHWVEDTRDQLLQMAAEEEQREQPSDARTPGATGPWSRVVAFLESMTAPRAVAWSAATAVTVAALAITGSLLTGQGAAERPGIATTTTPSSPAPTATDGGGPGPSPAAGVVLAASCTGGDGAYRVSYPEDWHAAGVDGGCTYFDAASIEVEDNTGGGPFTAISVRPLPVDLDTAAEPGRANRELSREQTTVDGRRAVRLLWESTGRAALPEGLRSYRYLVEFGERSLLAVTYDLDDTDFAERRELLDAMVASLELDDGAAAD